MPNHSLKRRKTVVSCDARKYHSQSSTNEVLMCYSSGRKSTPIVYVESEQLRPEGIFGEFFSPNFSSKESQL